MIITHYKLRIGMCREYKQYHEIEEGKGLVLLGIQACKLELNFLVAGNSSDFVFFLSFLAAWWNVCIGTPHNGGPISSGLD